MTSRSRPWGPFCPWLKSSGPSCAQHPLGSAAPPGAVKQHRTRGSQANWPLGQQGQGTAFPWHWGDRCSPEETSDKDHSSQFPHGDNPRPPGKPTHTEAGCIQRLRNISARTGVSLSVPPRQQEGVVLAGMGHTFWHKGPGC